MDPIEALQQIRALLQVAADRGSLDAIEKDLAAAQEIIKKALPVINRKIVVPPAAD